MLNQIQKQLSAEDQAAGAFKVGFHSRGIDEHGVEKISGFTERVIHESGRVRQDDPLHRRVRNIALMPKRYVFESSLSIRPHHPRQTADLFAGYGITLMRHSRRSLLFFTEKFFSFANFSALQMADFGRNLVQGAGNYR